MRLSSKLLQFSLWYACVRQKHQLPRYLTIVEYVGILLVAAAFLRWAHPFDPITRVFTGLPLWFIVTCAFLIDRETEQ